MTRRYLILVAALLIQSCLGATYAWSVFVQPLKACTGLGQGPIQLPFSVFYFVFPATMACSGRLLARVGPRLCALFGGILFAMGWLLAGLSKSHFLLTVLGIGLFGGVGVGLAYVVPIAVCILWFPRHKGLVTGIAVAGFGGGAALVSQVGGFLMANFHFTPYQTFFFFGLLFLPVVGLAALALQPPAGQELRRSSRISGRSLLAERPFRILYLCMFAGLAAGFAVNANLKEFYIGGSIRAGVTAVGCFAIANALGRITWGWVFDRVTSTHAIQSNLLIQALVLFASPWILQSNSGLLLFAILTGFNYGGVLVVYASSVARTWGAVRVAQVYGWLFTANIPAALSPLAAGHGFDQWGSFTPSLWMIAVLLVLASRIARKAAGIRKEEV